MSERLHYNPPVFFWIAEYTDGSCLCQFDPKSGLEAKFKSIDQSRLRSFGWYPVSRKLADLVQRVRLRVNPMLHICKVELGPGKRLIAHRQEKIHQVSIHACLKCGFIWQFRNAPGDLAYPWSALAVTMQDKKGRKIASAQCPKCQAYTENICSKCLIERTKYREGEGFTYRCKECARPLPNLIQHLSFEERHTEYFLGYAEEERRFIMKIDEGGNVEVN
jgi:Zn ribbon nucleic-acid-binding protein